MSFKLFQRNLIMPANIIFARSNIKYIRKMVSCYSARYLTQLMATA